MKTIYWSTVLAWSLTMMACNNQPIPTNSTEPEYEPSKYEQPKLSENLAKKGIIVLTKKHHVPREFGFTMDTFFRRYIELEEALVSSDTAKANSAASTMLFLLNLTDEPMNKEASAKVWKNHHDGYHKNLLAFLRANDLQKKRLYFSRISEYLYSTFKSFDMEKEDIHLAYCPMAFDKKGAYWLTDNHKIRNPYFGSKRLKCGRIIEILPE